MPARSVLVTLSLWLPAACGSAPERPLAPAQAAIEQVARQTIGLERLSLHAMGADEAVTVVASTDGLRIGRPSDKEDLTAMQTGKPVVLEEAGACDITVPVLRRDGRWTHAVGVTLRAAPGANRKPLVARARQIADEVVALLQPGT